MTYQEQHTTMLSFSPENPEYFVFLSEDELRNLAGAKNREDYQPELGAFLSATKKLSERRRLMLPSSDHVWGSPRLTLDQNGTVVDVNSQMIRAHTYRYPLPERPGEPQMAFSYDWFWEKFCASLCAKGVWAYNTESEMILSFPAHVSFSLEDEWAYFWSELASIDNVERSIGVYLDNKSLFKKQAKPWDSNDIPILSKDMAQYLISYYKQGRARKKHFKQHSIANAILDLEWAIQNGKYDTIPFWPKGKKDGHVQGGDFSIGQKIVRCAGCGDIIEKKNGCKRLAIFIKDSDERPQSARNKDDRSTYCKRCVATVFLCPVKLTRETLVVKFIEANPTKGRLVTTNDIEAELRKYVAQTLHVQAGSFIGLHLTEHVENGKSLCEVWGAYHYALWKLGGLFPAELFAQGFSIEVYPGAETFLLPRWSLWFLASLARWDSVFRYNCYAKREFRPHFAQFLRLLSRRKVFDALYVLISGGLIRPYEHSWRINQLQDIWYEFENISSKEEQMPIPDYPKIAGFAGLLLPLAERVQTSKKEGEGKRAVSKLLEEVDRPVQFTYTAGRESGASDFIFCKKPRNRYFFDKAMELLRWAGEDVASLKTEAERIVNEQPGFAWAKNAEEKVFICPDQIARVTGALTSEGEKPYENESDWRAFAYQVKLALWSMFPRYLGPQD